MIKDKLPLIPKNLPQRLILVENEAWINRHPKTKKALPKVGKCSGQDRYLILTNAPAILVILLRAVAVVIDCRWQTFWSRTLGHRRCRSDTRLWCNRVTRGMNRRCRWRRRRWRQAGFRWSCYPFTFSFVREDGVFTMDVDIPRTRLDLGFTRLRM